VQRDSRLNKAGGFLTETVLTLGYWSAVGTCISTNQSPGPCFNLSAAQRAQQWRLSAICPFPSTVQRSLQCAFSSSWSCAARLLICAQGGSTAGEAPLRYRMALSCHITCSNPPFNSCRESKRGDFRGEGSQENAPCGAQENRAGRISFRPVLPAGWSIRLEPTLNTLCLFRKKHGRRWDIR